MGDVVSWGGNTTLDLKPDEILESAKGELNEVVIIGWDKKDNFWLSGSKSRCDSILWLLKKCEQALMDS